MKRYTFVDIATQSYIALVAVLVVIFHGVSLPNWPRLLLVHVIVFGLIHSVICLNARFPSIKPIELFRHYYPIPLFIAFYRETELLNQMFYTGYLDAHFFRVEQWLFGTQPGLEMMNWFPNRWVAELLYAAYFSYYLMIGAVGLALLIRDKKQFAHFISITSFLFYVCYIVYICLPVVGPRIVFLEGLEIGPQLPFTLYVENFVTPESVQGAGFFQIMGWIYYHFESAGAAFPSSHVAVAICITYFSYLYLRRIRHVILLVTFLLCISTVYGRYHYVVDVAAGVLAAAVLIPLGNHLYFKFFKKNPSALSSHQ